MTVQEISEKRLGELLIGNNADSELSKMIVNVLNQANIYYRIFSRIKSPQSVAGKLIRKQKKYENENKGMQDIIGIRVVLYYYDDIPICKNILSNVFNWIPEDSEEDIPNVYSFEPVRKNYIFHLPDALINLFPEKIWTEYKIEKTFELQIRSIFSEGWYEVEHDIRYKHKQEWECEGYYKHLRGLSTINATLEICDHELVRRLDDLAYDCYKKSEIQKMLRYKLRIRIENEDISDALLAVLEADKTVVKKLFRMDRGQILRYMSHPRMPIWPHNLQNIIFLCNEMKINSAEIRKLTPVLLLEKLNRGISAIQEDMK